MVDQLVLGAADRGQHGRRGEQPVVHVERAHHLAQERPLVLGIVDEEPGIDPDRRSRPAEDPAADGVERPHPHGAGNRRTDEALHPRAHFPGRLVGERHRQDPLRRDAPALDQRGDPVGQDPGLAGAGAGQHEERPVSVVDRLTLGGVEERVDLGDRPRGGGG